MSYPCPLSTTGDRLELPVAEQLIGRSRVAAINGLEHLTAAGILKRRRNQRKGDNWEAKELFALLDRFEAAVQAH